MNPGPGGLDGVCRDAGIILPTLFPPPPPPGGTPGSSELLELELLSPGLASWNDYSGVGSLLLYLYLGCGYVAGSGSAIFYTRLSSLSTIGTRMLPFPSLSSSVNYRVVLPIGCCLLIISVYYCVDPSLLRDSLPGVTSDLTFGVCDINDELSKLDGSLLLYLYYLRSSS